MDILALLHDSTFWVLIAFVVFAYFAYKYGAKPILAILDMRTETIRKEIDEAETLKREAQTLLAEYQQKHRDAMSEAEQIVERAKQHAKSYELEAKQSLETSLERRRVQAEEKINLAKEKAIQDIRERIIDLSTYAAQELLEKNMKGKAGDQLIDDAIEQIEKSA